MRTKLQKLCLRCGSAGLLFLGLSGCQSIQPEWMDKLPWSTQPRIEESQYESPQRLVAIWTPDVVTTPGKKPTRGFGGRLYFYSETGSAIPVEGQLIIYAYQEEEGGNESSKPSKKFVITPDQFTAHFSETDLGASYSVWIPWDHMGGEQLSISLLPVFTSTKGQIVMGHQALNFLPGKKPKKVETETEDDSSGIQQVGFLDRSPTSPQRNEGLRMKTTTISIPRTMRQRMTSSGQQTGENRPGLGGQQNQQQSTGVAMERLQKLMEARQRAYEALRTSPAANPPHVHFPPATRQAHPAGPDFQHPRGAIQGS